MDKFEIIEKLKSIIKPYVKDDEAFENLNEHPYFISDLRINSANLVYIILDIEEVFYIVIDNQSMEKMLDVKTTLLIIEAKLNEK